MNNELLLLIKKYTHTLIEQTKTKSQETLEYKMNKQMETFTFPPPISLGEEGKWLSGVTSLECTNSVFSMTNESNLFSISIRGHWNSESSEEIIYKLNELIELKPENVKIELHVEEVRKRGYQIKKNGMNI